MKFTQESEVVDESFVGVSAMPVGDTPQHLQVYVGSVVLDTGQENDRERGGGNLAAQNIVWYFGHALLFCEKA